MEGLETEPLVFESFLVVPFVLLNFEEAEEGLSVERSRADELGLIDFEMRVLYFGVCIIVEALLVCCDTEERLLKESRALGA